MNFRYALSIAAIVVVGVACGGPEESPPATESSDVDAAIDALFAPWDQPGSPGCALAVAQNGQSLYARGYGYADLDHDVPVTPETVFDVGSLTKQFIAASITMLEQEGQLSLDDSVRRWLPELPELNQPITLRHMIYHTSGLRDYLTLFPLAGRGHYYPISHAQVLDMMSRQRALVFAPGERYLYSNTAYMLLAQVIERASGQTPGEFVDEHIFAPLAMQDSLMYDDRERIIARRATGYDRHDASDLRVVHNFNFDVPGDGQMYTTVLDLLRWDEYLHGAAKPAIHAAMLAEGALNDGAAIARARGLFLGEYRGLRTVQHTGSSWGFRAALVRFVEPELAIAIACNDGLASPLQLAHRIADYLLEDELEPKSDDERRSEDSGASEESSPPVVSPERLNEFSGSYYSAELDAIYRFAIVDDGLSVRIEQEAPLRVLPAANDQFTISFDEQAYSGILHAELSFDRGAGGDITGFRLSSGTERDIAFERFDVPDVGSP